MSWDPAGFVASLPLQPVPKGAFDRYVYESCEACTKDERPLVDALGNPAGTVKDYIRTDGQVLAKVLYHVEGRDDEYFIAQ